MSVIRRETIAVTGATGGVGAATASARSTGAAITGTIIGVHLTYAGSPPALSTDVTVAGATAPATEILFVENAATDGWFYPMHQAVDAADASAITNQGLPIVVNDQIIATIAGANDGDGVTVVIDYEASQP